jgi:hypothetical protein
LPYFAPVDAATYSARTAYVSLGEFKNAPTGTDWNSMLPSAATQPQKDTVLKQCLMRASSWADEICHQVLAATIQWKQGRSIVRQDDWGRLCFDAVIDQTPLIGVAQVNVGTAMNDFVALSDLSMLEPRGRNVVRVYLTGGSAASTVSQTWIGVGQKVLWQLQYIAGYANAALTAVPSGASLAVDNVLGFNPGQQLTTAGLSAVEYPVVASTWTPSATGGPGTLPLASATTGTYYIGDSVSTMPPSIKEAVINLTTVAIRERGQWAIVARTIRDQGDALEGLDSPSTNAIDLAMALLDDHRRVV